MNGADCGCTATPINLRRPEGAAPVGVIKDNAGAQLRGAGDWVKIPVRRGVGAVEPILRLCDRHGGRIMGGYARFACSPRDRPALAGDVDVFPVGAGDPAECFAALYRALLAEGFEPIAESKFSVSFENPGSARMVGVPDVQLIKPFREAGLRTFGPVAAVLASFDFSVTCVALEPDRATAIAHRTFLSDEAALRLRVIKPVDPVATMRRALRYAARGYTMSRREAVQLFLEWEARPEEVRKKVATEVGL